MSRQGSSEMQPGRIRDSSWYLGRRLSSGRGLHELHNRTHLRLLAAQARRPGVRHRAEDFRDLHLRSSGCQRAVHLVAAVRYVATHVAQFASHWRIYQNFRADIHKLLSLQMYCKIHTRFNMLQKHVVGPIAWK